MTTGDDVRWRDQIVFDDNSPRCDEFYYSRMPQWYETVDLITGFIYLFNYILIIFISQNRCQYFISNESKIELIIIAPRFLFGYKCPKYGLLLKALSRVLRLTKVEVFLKSAESNEDSNVSEQIKKIAVDLLIILMMSAVLFMVLENFEPEYYPLEVNLRFYDALYCMCVTLMTVGYGDFYPYTVVGQMFIIVIILYVIVYKLAESINELLRLMGLKSFYARTFYQSNNEIPHVVITGQVVITAL